MVAVPPPPLLIFVGDVKIPDPNNWGGGGGPEQKIKFKGGPKIQGGLQHFTSRKLAEVDLLLNIKKMFFYVSDTKF